MADKCRRCDRPRTESGRILILSTTVWNCDCIAAGYDDLGSDLVETIREYFYNPFHDNNRYLWPEEEMQCFLDFHWNNLDRNKLDDIVVEFNEYRKNNLTPDVLEKDELARVEIEQYETFVRLYQQVAVTRDTKGDK